MNNNKEHTEPSRIRNKNNDIIEIDLSGLNPSKRLQLFKHLYYSNREQLLIAKSQGKCLEPDDFIRKTYWIKSDTVQAFSKDAGKRKIGIGKLVSDLLTNCVNAVETGMPLPSPAKPEKNAPYEKKSYRVQYSVAMRFDELCVKNKVPAGPVLQTLMEEHLKKG